MRKGDNLTNANGKKVTIASIESLRVQKTSVYNFEVADTHVYLVGLDGVVVHNYLPVMGDGWAQVAAATGRSIEELKRLNPGMDYPIYTKDIKVDPRVTVDTDTKYGAKANESLAEVVMRYNSVNGTNYSVADIKNMPENRLINSPLILTAGDPVVFPERDMLTRMGNNLTLAGRAINNVGTVVADGVRNVASTVLNNPILNLHQTVKNQYDASSGINAVGYALLSVPTYLANIPFGGIKMIGGTVLQPMSPVDYSYGAIGTALGLVYGTANILMGQVPVVKNGVVQFRDAPGFGAGAGLSLGPVIFGRNSPKPRDPDYPFGHEYGHTIQNRTYGPGYIKTMMRSLGSAITSPATHSRFETEVEATLLGTEEYYRRTRAAK